MRLETLQAIQSDTHVLKKIDELEGLVSSVKCKVLIARGGRSRIISDEKTAALAARFPDARWTTIPNAPQRPGGQSGGTR